MDYLEDIPADTVLETLNTVIPVLNGILLTFSIGLLYFGVATVVGSIFFGELTEDLKKKLSADATKMGVPDLDTDALNVGPFVMSFGATVTIFAVFSVAACILTYMMWFLKICICGRAQLIFVPLLGMNAVLFLALFSMMALHVEENTFMGQLLLSDLSDKIQYYKGIESEEEVSVTLNAFMSYYNCCGSFGYQDFGKATYWPRTDVAAQPQDTTLKTPLLCCKKKSKDYTCAIEPDAKNNWYNTGCFYALRDHVVAYDLVYYTGYAYLLLQGILIIATLVFGLCTLLEE